MAITSAEATRHARHCGVSLDKRRAIPVENIGRGRWLAMPIIHPETQKAEWPAGYWIDNRDIPRLLAMGVDYVVVER